VREGTVAMKKRTVQTIIFLERLSRFMGSPLFNGREGQLIGISVAAKKFSILLCEIRS
jgi:hypothetical protein